MQTVRHEFENLIDQIITTEYPESKDIYAFERDEVFESLFNPKEETGELGVNRFGLDNVLTYINSIIATFSAFLKLVDWFKSQKEKREKIVKEMTIVWIEELVKEGIVESDAKRIAERYKDHLLKIIESKL